jgi:putative transposase
VINFKKVRRLYQEEGLQLKPRKHRRRAATLRQPRATVGAPHERWAMDFMHDVLATGQSVRVFTLVDVCSRECVALEVARSFSGTDVARLLSEAGDRVGGLPPIIQCDNGTEFTSTALDHWAYWNHVQLDFSRPGNRPTTVCARRSMARSDVSAPASGELWATLLSGSVTGKVVLASQLPANELGARRADADR